MQSFSQRTDSDKPIIQSLVTKLLDTMIWHTLFSNLRKTSYGTPLGIVGSSSRLRFGWLQ